MISLRTHIPWAILVGAAVLSSAVGCNSGSSTKTDQVAQQPSPAAPSGDESDSAPAQPAEPQPGPKQKAKKAEPKSPALGPNVNPNDVFAVVPGQKTFEVAEADGKPLSADTFTAILPPKGLDSTHFEPADPSINPPPRKPVPTPAPSSAVQRSTDHRPGDRKMADRKMADHKTGDHKLSDRRPGDHRPGDRTTSDRNGGRTTGDRKGADRTLADRQLADRKHESPAGVGESTSPGNRLPAGFTPLAAAKSQLGLPQRIRCDRDNSEMALVTGGAVVVGHDGGPAESSPQISVLLDSFYMDVTEVTVGQYEAFRQALREEKGRGVISEPPNHSSPADFPVLGVTLTQAEFYAKWAGKELPSEAEWERAARGESVFDHPWGNGRAIWKHVRAYDEIDPVKSFRTDVSPFGIYDLAGNAREWCIDNFSPTAFGDAIKSNNGQLRGWKGPRVGKPDGYHVVKGNGPGWDAWYRAGMSGIGHHSDVGFRCVLRIPEKKDD